jgi:hypothetical protein
MNRHGSIRRMLLAGTSLAGIGLLGVVPATAQELDYVTLDYGTTGTFLTGIRGDTITGNDTIGEGSTGGLMYRTDTGVWVPFTEATPTAAISPAPTARRPMGRASAPWTASSG